MKITLRTPHWDENKRLYRPGVHDVSAKLAAAWGGAEAEADAFDVETATLDELKAEAERRGVTVTRGDGGDGAPLKADYQAALK